MVKAAVTLLVAFVDAILIGVVHGQGSLNFLLDILLAPVHHFHAISFSSFNAP
jgi:hypothetical protein